MAKKKFIQYLPNQEKTYIECSLLGTVLFDLTIYTETYDWVYAMIHTIQNYKKTLNFQTFVQWWFKLMIAINEGIYDLCLNFTAAAAPSQSHEQNLGVWQLIHPYDRLQTIFLHPAWACFLHWWVSHLSSHHGLALNFFSIIPSGSSWSIVWSSYMEAVWCHPRRQRHFGEFRR